MNCRNRIFRPFLLTIFCAASALALALALQTAAQSPKQPAATAPMTDRDAADIQEQLVHLLRQSPVLTSVVARDPSLLADQAYVTRSNPELEQFIQAHPDVARNPEFYLFSHIDQGKGHRDQVLERTVWPDLVPPPNQMSHTAEVVDKIIPMIVVPAIFGAIVWIVWILLQTHRWNRTYKQQSELQGRLIDKFSSSQDLAAYMQSEAGKRFLEGMPVSLGSGGGMRMPNAVARVLTPLQIGIVMTLLGIGLILLRNAGPDMATPMTVMGVLALTPGIGFILSAGVTWFLARRLGLLPEKDEAAEAAAPFNSQGRQ